MLGIETQETQLGLYKDENVVVIKDFLGEDEVFVPFNGVGDSSLEQDKEKYQYSYEDIIGMLKDNVKLTDVKQTVDLFWDMFIVDALIANSPNEYRTTFEKFKDRYLNFDKIKRL